MLGRRLVTVQRPGGQPRASWARSPPLHHHQTELQHTVCLLRHRQHAQHGEHNTENTHIFGGFNEKVTDYYKKAKFESFLVK